MPIGGVWMDHAYQIKTLLIKGPWCCQWMKLVSRYVNEISMNLILLASFNKGDRILLHHWPKMAHPKIIFSQGEPTRMWPKNPHMNLLQRSLRLFILQTSKQSSIQTFSIQCVSHRCVTRGSMDEVVLLVSEQVSRCNIISQVGANGIIARGFWIL